MILLSLLTYKQIWLSSIVISLSCFQIRPFMVQLDTILSQVTQSKLDQVLTQASVIQSSVWCSLLRIFKRISMYLKAIFWRRVMIAQLKLQHLSSAVWLTTQTCLGQLRMLQATLVDLELPSEVVLLLLVLTPLSIKIMRESPSLKLHAKHIHSHLTPLQ